MQQLTTEQLNLVREQINQRLAEFGVEAMPTVSLGIVRMTHDVLREFCGEHGERALISASIESVAAQLASPVAVEVPAPVVTPTPAELPQPEPVAEVPQAATVAPTPVEAAPTEEPKELEQPTTFRVMGRTLAEVDAEAKAKTMTLAQQKAAERMALREKVFTFLRQIAVDGVMPALQEYNERKPADFPNATDLMNRLGFMSWRDVATDAKLSWTGKGRSIPRVEATMNGKHGAHR